MIMPDISTRTVAVYGALRSGTTLLRLMLDAHSRLSCPGETDFLFDHLRMQSDPPVYDEEALERDRIYRAHRTRYAGTPLPALTPDALIDRIAGTDKTAVLMLHRHISRALALYPDLRLIHFLRDPRDVARSSIGMGWAGDVYHGVDHWIDTERDWAAVSRTLSPDQVLTIRYEDLINDPGATLQAICHFIGVAYEASMLDYDQSSTYSKPSRDLVVQWRHKLTARETGLVEAKIGPMLDDAGYSPSGVAPHHPSGAEKIALKFGNKYAIWAERIRRFGLMDPVIVTLAHRLCIPRLSVRARRRMDEKTIKRLK